MELVEGWLPKSQPSRTWTLLGGVCALLGSCPKPNKTKLFLRNTAILPQNKKEKEESIDLLLINHNYNYNK